MRPATNAQRQRLTLPSGVTLEVERIAPATTSKSCIVLVPGAGAPLEFWPAPWCAALTEAGHEVVRYCHRDTGASDHFDAPYALDVLLGELLELVAELGCPRVHLVGHSMGGYLAQLAVTGDRPGPQLASATSIAAGPTVDPERFAALDMQAAEPATWEVLMRNQPTGDFEADLPGWLASWRFLNGTRPFDEPSAVRYTRALYRGDPRNAQVATNHIHAMTTLPASLEADLATATTPLLALHGSEDPLVPPSHGRASAAVAGSGRFRAVQCMGHMVFDPATWDELADAVLEHVASSSPARDA